ncbi:MAG: anthranilate phosphoribosyltransferase [Deltaproteobacteria bacterium]|nr:anthranilate phosphoribosyltransferase [Deltaproteobacteria bacterium]MCB9785890.1 anthranilate phosphoribosyltransferase [Deltaproteobacteria bacterium]
MTGHGGLRLALERLVEGRDLSAEQMAAALGEVMDGQAEAVPLAAFLTALRVKGETADELFGAVQAMRSRAEGVRPRASRLLDTCGTGGDGAGTFNVSTAVALVCAAAGVPVAKHGNRAISSRVGSADVLEALGVRIDLGPEAVTRCIDEVGIGFMFAPRHHGALRHAAPVRRALGFRTVLNLLGPLTNPAGATHQLVGLFDRRRLSQVAAVLGRLGTSRALVVAGDDGLDELTLSGPSHAALWDGQAVRELTITPEQVGVSRASLDALRGGDAALNARIVGAILDGEPGPPADIVRLNAGAALWVAEAASDLADGVAQATELLRAGAARQTLDRLVARTAELAP